MKILRSALLLPFLILSLVLLTSTDVAAQETTHGDTPRFTDPVPSFKDERDVFDLAKLQAEVQARYPRIRFDGSLDIQDVSAPADKQKRFEYTIAMLDLVSAWVALDLGSTLLKALEGQVESKKEDAAFLSIYAHFAMIYPAFSPRTTAAVAEKTIAKALEVDPEFAPALYLKALYYYIIVIPNNLAPRRPSLDTAITALNAARKAQPDYSDATYLEAEIEHLEKMNVVRAAELLKPLLEGDDLSPPMYVKALRAYHIAAGSEAGVFLSKLLEKTQSPMRTGLLKRDLAESAYRDQKFEDCITLANEALQHLQGPAHAVLAQSLRLEVLVNAHKRLTLEAGRLAKAAPDDEKAQERFNALKAKTEKLFEEVVDLDVTTLTTLDERKSDAAMYYASFAVDMGSEKRALEILRDYDKRAAPLNRIMRAELRRRISDLQIKVEKTINIVLLKELAQAADWRALAMELAKYDLLEERDPGALPLSEPETVKLLLEFAGNTDRLVAAGSMLLLARASSGVAEDQKPAIVEAVAKRAALDTAAATKEQRALLKDALTALATIGTKGALTSALDILEPISERLDKESTMRSDFLIYLKSVSDCAGKVLDTKPDYGRREYSSTASAKAWIQKVRNQVK